MGLTEANSLEAQPREAQHAANFKSHARQGHGAEDHRSKKHASTKDHWRMTMESNKTTEVTCRCRLGVPVPCTIPIQVLYSLGTIEPVPKKRIHQ